MRERPFSDRVSELAMVRHTPYNNAVSGFAHYVRFTEARRLYV
jgi:hypothetical protein